MSSRRKELITRGGKLSTSFVAIDFICQSSCAPTASSAGNVFDPMIPGLLIWRRFSCTDILWKSLNLSIEKLKRSKFL